MVNIADPYKIRYPRIVAVADEGGERVELVEFFDCIGGAMWSKHHYVQSPLVISARTVGASVRYLLRPGQVDLELQGSKFPAGICGVNLDKREIQVSYIGIGGGGVGASAGRASADGVTRCTVDPSGGGRKAGSTIWLPRRQRVLIGVDDTDTPTDGATWTLVHNIARAVEDSASTYLSHTIVQLFPVAYRTKNCVSLVAEFGTTEPGRLVDHFTRLLERYTLSEETGMAVYTGFDPSGLLDFSRKVKRGEVSRDMLLSIDDVNLRIVKDGRGCIGAVAAIPLYTQYEEALALCTETM